MGFCELVEFSPSAQSGRHNFQNFLFLKFGYEPFFINRQKKFQFRFLDARAYSGTEVLQTFRPTTSKSRPLPLVVPWAIKISGPYFNIVVDTIGPKTDFTLESNRKKLKKSY